MIDALIPVVLLVDIATLIVAIRTLRSSQSSENLNEDGYELLRDQRGRLAGRKLHKRRRDLTLLALLFTKMCHPTDATTLASSYHYLFTTSIYQALRKPRWAVDHREQKWILRHRLVSTYPLILGQQKACRLLYVGYHVSYPRAQRYAPSEGATSWLKSSAVKHHVFEPKAAARLGSSE